MALPIDLQRRQLEALEISLLLEGVYQRYGYDFRGYARGSLRRRILQCLADERLPSITALLERVLHERECFTRLLSTLGVPFTTLFRNPSLYRSLAQVEGLREKPFRRIWHAGCSTGEEVYSTAIWLEEAGLYGSSRLYGTDFNEAFLRHAQAGAYPLDSVRQREPHYREAGGQRALREHYSVQAREAAFAAPLKRNLVWGHHNLTSDASFNEFDLVCCRNVLIYFDSPWQARVHRLLYESLALGGLLVLGNRERLEFTPHQSCYEVVDEREKIYRKVR